MKEYAEDGKQLHIALSGGSTPLRIFQELAEQTSREDWSNVSLYWGDERCVPPDHPDSNYGRLRQLLIEPLNLPQEPIHRIRGEEMPPDEDRPGEAGLPTEPAGDALTEPTGEVVAPGRFLERPLGGFP